MTVEQVGVLFLLGLAIVVLVTLGCLVTSLCFWTYKYAVSCVKDVHEMNIPCSFHFSEKVFKVRR